MKRFWKLFLCMTLAAVTVNGWGNLIKNADFSEMSPVGLPRYWNYRSTDTEALSVKDGTISFHLGKGGENQFFIYRNLGLTPGEKYQLSYEIMGTEGGTYRFYFESVAGENKRLAINATVAKVPVGWLKRSFTFTAPPAGQYDHLVINLQKGTTFSLRGITLLPLAEVKETAAVNLLVNGDFSEKNEDGLPRYWEYRTANKAALQAGNGLLSFDLFSGGDKQFMILRNLAVEGGKRYAVSYEVRGTGNARYRLYFESVGKGNKRGAVHAEILSASTEWTKQSFFFTAPKDKMYDQLVINPQQGKNLEIRGLTLMECSDEEAATESQPTVLGGKVEFNGKSRLLQIGKSEQFDVAFVNNYLAGAVIRGVPVKAGEHYELTFEVKGNAPESPHYQGFSVGVDLNFTNVQDIIRSAADDTWNAGFQKKSFSFQVPADYRWPSVNILLYAKDGSKVIFGNLALQTKKIDPADQLSLTITSPAYRNSFYASVPVKLLAGFIAGDSSCGTADIALFKEGEKVREAKISFVDGRGDFSFDASDLAAGAYRLQVGVFDRNGKLLREFNRPIHKYPPASVEVVADQNLQFHVNGKPFLPIHHWSLTKAEIPISDDMLQYLAASGANLIMLPVKNAEDALRELDRAKKFNLMVLLRPTYPGRDDDNSVRQWLQEVYNTRVTPEIMQHEALFGYILVDEPAWLGVPYKNLQAGYEALKKMDPYHPIWINAAPRGSVDLHRQYSQAADIYGVDIYPVGSGSHSGLDDKSIRCIGKYARRMSDCVDGLKPNWQVLQAFAWGELSEKKDNLIYPDKVQSRFMAYDSLLNNAQSIGYYGFYHNLTPAFLDTIRDVTREIQNLSALFVKGKVIASDRNDDFIYKVFEYNGRKYLIAINYHDREQKITIKTPFGVPQLTLFPENRAIRLDHGVLSDTFGPLEVRIYGDGPLPTPLNPLPEYHGENPWLHYKEMIREQEKKSYGGAAWWIWDRTMLPNGVLSRKFMLDKPVKAAKLMFTADNSARMFVNGSDAGINSSWNIMKVVDATKWLKQGENELRAEVSDDGNGLFGFLADLSITFTDGTTMQIDSDQSWKGKSGGEDDWSAVAVIAPYGRDRWGKRVVPER